MANELISAVFDGECSPQELDRLLDAFEQSPELKTTWSRMSLARDTHEDVHVRRGQPCICAGVMARIAAEPVASGGKVVPLFRQRVNRYWKPVVGLAAAASVAAVALTLDFAGRDASVPAAPETLARRDASMAVPVSSRQPRYLPAVATTDPARAAFEDDLRQYLIEHSNTLADRGMSGTLSYARFATHSVDDPMMVRPVSLEAQP
ncbi:MAG: sigma-E factor negative regulatory protein [Nevskiales bacterium]|nr:sigma-E factor negative regulatory protein [Nevskiales bacterium]